MPNKARRTKLHRARPTVGLLLGNTWYSLAWDVWAGVDDATKEHDANLLCFAGDDLNAPFEFYAQANILYALVSAESVDGLVIWGGGLGQYVHPKEVRAFCEQFRPLPMVNAALPLEDIPTVLVDNYQAMHDVIEHLVEGHGYRRIAFIRGPEGHPEAEERFRAYTDVLAEHGLPLDPHLIAPGDFNPDSGTEAVNLLLDQRKLLPQTDFEAIAAADDGMAIKAMEALQARGIQVPGDVAVTGLDNIEEGWYTFPSLTTVPLLVYEQARRATEMVLALLEGAKVPDQVILPTRVVVRQSCGCSTPAVIQTAVGTRTRADETFETALAARRKDILSAMIRAVESSSVGDVPEGVAQLLDTFVAELSDPLARQTSSGVFLSALDEVLSQGIVAGGNLTVWQGAISVLRCHTLPILDDEAASRAEDLWQQARVVIGETAQWGQVRRRLKTEQRTQVLNEVSQTLITTFDMTKLMDTAAEGLDYLGIKSAYLSLYEDAESPLEWSRLIMAYDEKGRIALPAEGRRFPSRHLVPDGLLPSNRQYSMVIEPLYFQEDQLGFAVFEAEPREAMIYDALRGQISSALKGTLLIQERERAEETLKRRATQLAIINDIGGKITAMLDLDSLIDRAARLVQENFGYDQVSLLTLDHEQGELVMKARVGSLAGIFSLGNRLKMGQGMVGWVARHGETLLANDVSAEPRYFNPLPGVVKTQSELVVPVRVGREVIGVLDIQSPQLDTFDENDVMVMETLAHQIAVAIENARLYEEARSRAKRLAILNLIAEAANKELEAFSYSVSHDLRAPLRHIDGFVQLFLKREEGKLDSTSLRYLNAIAESSAKMNQLIDDLLTLSRTGQAEMQVRPVDLNEMVKKVQQELAPALEKRHITWEIGPLPSVEADPALLRQVWVNLLSNAIKYTAPRPEARIEIGAIQHRADKSGEVTIFVRDNGVGFDPQYEHKLFGVFQRLHREDEFEGTGIGLATVRRIIHRHGGRVWAEGAVDQGATFYFTLRVPGKKSSQNISPA